jgi:hypothetical protein
MNKTISRLSAGFGVSGRVKIQVVDAASGRIVEDRPWQRNLILNGGLDSIADRSFAASFVTAAAGTGNTPTSDDSGAVTASQSGTTITLSGSHAEMAANRVIKWDSGEMARIVSGSGTSWEADRSQTVSAGEFTTYRANQTQLATWVKNTATYLSGSANCGHLDTSAVGGDPAFRTMFRTFDFSTEVGSVNYTELGFHWSSVGTNNPTLFSRILISGGAVSLVSGQLLRVKYELRVTVSPSAAAVPGTLSITGWPVSPATDTEGDSRWQTCGLAGINSAGATVAGNSGIAPLDGASAGEPSGNLSICALSPSTAALQTTFSATSRSTNAIEKGSPTVSSYSAGTFTRTKTWVFGVNDGNRTDYRSLIIGNSASGLAASADGQVMVFLFDQNQTKDNLHTLTIVARWSWDLDLS